MSDFHLVAPVVEAAMTENLIRTSELCERLQMGEASARSAMADYGVYPIHFGIGRGRGLRWLSSAVDEAIRSMHEQAQPQKHTTEKGKDDEPDICDLSIDDLFSLTRH